MGSAEDWGIGVSLRRDVRANLDLRADAHGLLGLRAEKRAEVHDIVQQARAAEGTVVIDFRVEQEDSVYPMVPAGADLHAMIRRPSPLVETADDPI